MRISHVDHLEAIRDLRFPAQLPRRLLHVRRHMERPRVGDTPAAVAHALAPLLVSVQPGARVAVGVGSRGIHNLPLIVRSVIQVLRARGAAPVARRAAAR